MYVEPEAGEALLASDLPPANQSAASTDFTMMAVTLGSLRRIPAVRSLATFRSVVANA